MRGQTCVQVFFIRGGRNNGNRAFFPTHTKAEEAGDVLAAFVAQFYDDKPPPPLVLVNHPLPEQDTGRRGAEPEGADLRHRTAGGGGASAARREARGGAACRDQCARGAGTQTCRERGTGQAAGRHGGTVRPAGAARADRGLRQQPHHGHEPVRRHDRGRARGVHEGGIPEVQHPRAGDPRRRFRDDARGADAPLHPRAEGGGGGREPRAGRTWC